jgi:hypothetical protein
MGGLNLKSIVLPPNPPDTSAGDIIRRIKNDLNAKEHQRKQGLVTTGFIDVTFGFDWGVSDLILFPFKYTEKPVFTWGIEGTYSGDTTNTSPYTDTGKPDYTMELPQALTDYITNEDYITFSPAVFVPRIVHWYKSGTSWLGCYILISQVNKDCTEPEDKIFRLHFRFEGAGIA